MTITVPQAIVLAATAHGEQRDKIGHLYLRHVLRVMEGCAPDESAMIVGVLHDVAEDTKQTVKALFNQGVPVPLCHAIDALTHRPNETNAAYWGRVAGNPLALRVKWQDLIDNTLPWKVKMLAAINQPKAEQLAMKYARAANFLDERDPSVSQIIVVLGNLESSGLCPPESVFQL